MGIWIVMLEERRTDNEAFPYSTEALAIAAANTLIDNYEIDRDHPSVEKELTAAMHEAGWAFYFCNRYKDFYVWIEKKTLDMPLDL